MGVRGGEGRGGDEGGGGRREGREETGFSRKFRRDGASGVRISPTQEERVSRATKYG